LTQDLTQAEVDVAIQSARLNTAGVGGAHRGAACGVDKASCRASVAGRAGGASAIRRTG
jgi:hypothetical protein